MRLIIILSLLINNILAQDIESAISAWNNIMQTPEIVDYFDGVFDKQFELLVCRYRNIEKVFNFF